MTIGRFIGQTTRERAKRQAIVQAIFMTVMLILGIVFQVWLLIPLVALAYVAIAVFYFAVKRDTRSDKPY
jgi:c-di-AMP phosphodiesterase-like protein